MSAHLGRCLAIAVSGALCASCSAGWNSGRAVSSATPLAPPCRVSQLSIGHFSQGAGGAQVGGITFQVARGPRCSLRGRPHVAFSGGTAGTVPWRSYALPALDEPGLNRPPDVLRSLRHRDRVLASLHWDQWCAKHGYEPPPAPTALVVTLPTGGPEVRLGLRRHSTPRCDVPGTTSGLGIGPFVATKT